ncbi:exocyst complex component Sec6 [Polychaeton citri CBS 116435]|uniref:Exocyst complex component Sec6 n=1 Tax=Polychaeton citri CBS 116435 TaxID=1314669 RepID=A0A9P4UJC7_9PEZI|nr:exocyst complex component Sec6 [Polychaeton citri CBS 116435]
MDPYTSTAEDSLSKLAESLKHPDDLDKLPSLKSQFTLKKSDIDVQLKHMLADQLQTTQAGFANVVDAQKIINLIKEEMQQIDKLCAESQGMLKSFPELERMSVMQRNFAAVESMKASVDSFAARLQEMEELLREDDENLENQPNLLAVHEGISALRDVRDQAMDQVKMASNDAENGAELIENLPLPDGNGATLRELFGKLDEVVDWFDEHVGHACINLIPLVISGNNGIAVRLALVIEEEEKKDRQTKALQDAQREFQDVANRFRAMNLGHREIRGYKKKFLQAVEATALAQFEGVNEAFEGEPDKLEKSVKWYFNDLNAVKLGLVELMPIKWNIFRTYARIYHRLMHDFLVGRLDDDTISPVHMLAILHWVPKYYSKMLRLGFKEDDLRPQVIDERESELVREYRNLITTAVEQWMDRMGSLDRKNLISRAEDSLDTDADGHFHTKTLSDLWRMLSEQLAVAESSSRPDVVEGVIDSMIRALKQRQQMWQALVDQEAEKFRDSLDPATVEGFNTLQDWLVAIANDQITNIDDDPATNTTSFLSRFRADYEPLVSPAYGISSTPDLDSLRDGYVDLGTHCISLFASLIFSVDFRTILLSFFTPQWYTQKGMAQITTTFEDYMNDYTHVLHPSLRDILVEELADELLARYLSCIVRNSKAIKFRRSDNFTEKIKEDVVTVFNFFKNYADSFETIKDKWRVIHHFEELLSADKGTAVVQAYENFKANYWDLQIGWVEAVLRCRDDFDRSMLSAVKSRAAELAGSGDRGLETIMSKVK